MRVCAVACLIWALTLATYCRTCQAASKLQPTDPKDAYRNYFYLDDNEEWVDTVSRKGRKLLKKSPKGDYAVPDIMLRDADPKKYFSAKTTEPVRLSNVTLEQFQEYHKKGIPVIVTDVTKNWPMKKWSCDVISDLFSKEKMRQEYTEAASSDKNDQKLSDRKWMDKKLPLSKKESQAGPKFAPWYFDFKDNPDLSKAGRRILERSTKVPYFFPQKEYLRTQLSKAAEIWLSRSGAGAKAHSDGHCMSTMSIQLSGTKRWRLGMPSLPESVAETRTFTDGSTETDLWNPEYEFELHEGEGIFMPSSMVHETNNIGDSCAASITYQYNLPGASVFSRSFLPRLAFHHECGICAKGWIAPLATLRRGKPARDLETAEKAAKKTFRKVDSNGDGALSLGELEQFLEGLGDGLTEFDMVSETLGDDSSTTADFIPLIAREVMDYHDLDEDGKVSAEEFVSNFKAWHATLIAKRASMRPLVRYGLEKKKLRKQKGKRCRGANGVAAQSVCLRLAHSNTNAKTDSEYGSLSEGCQQLADICMRAVRDTRLNVEFTLPGQVPASATKAKVKEDL